MEVSGPFYSPVALTLGIVCWPLGRRLCWFQKRPEGYGKKEKSPTSIWNATKITRPSYIWLYVSPALWDIDVCSVILLSSSMWLSPILYSTTFRIISRFGHRVLWLRVFVSLPQSPTQEQFWDTRSHPWFMWLVLPFFRKLTLDLLITTNFDVVPYRCYASFPAQLTF
jgi:hypothetical protein